MFNETTNSLVSSLSNISADVFGILGAILLLVALGMANGKKLLIVILVSLYPAGLITFYFPYYGYLTIGTENFFSSLEPIILFFVTLLACIFVLKNYFDTSYQSRTFWRYLELVTISVTTVGLSIAMLYNIAGIENFYNFSILVDSMFSSPLALWLWFLAPLVNIPLFVRV